MAAKPLTDEQKEDAARLKAIFEQRKQENPSLTQEALAFLCEWKTQGAVSQYMLGRVPLNLAALLKFSKALSVHPREISPKLSQQVADFVLANQDGQVAVISESKPYPAEDRRSGGDRRYQVEESLTAYGVPLNKYRFPPVIGKGIGGPTDRDYTDGDYPVGASDRYAEVPTADPNAFITPIDEDSMYPKYPKGDFALVEPNTTIDLEDDVLVKTKDDGPILKRLLSRRGGVIRLGSYNRQDVISIPEEDVKWMYYVAFPVPAKKIKTRI
jgi:phage repressor protein C with HTH and peptisase S24 domain